MYRRALILMTRMFCYRMTSEDDNEQPKVKQINKSIVIKMQIVNASVVDVVTVSAILPII